MKPFVFTLQSLYDVKKNKVKQQKIKLQSLAKELADQAGALKALEEEFVKVKEEYRRTAANGVLAKHAVTYDLYFVRLKAAMALIQDKIQRIEKEKDKCMEELVAMNQETKLLDTLRENEYGEYMQALKKEQAKYIDDFFSYKVIVSG